MASEKRKKERLQEEVRVAVTILSAEDAPDLVNKTFFCPTEDVSAGGLRLCLHHAVPKNAELVLRIAFQHPVRSFKHIGRVAWMRRGSFRGYPVAIGVELTELQAGTAEAWGHMLERKLRDADPKTRTKPAA
ncbi:MAG: PilZ domain-containing protein [Verrucomicrobia bacterium]|nr:PilZ domain-containing protein [Verrucomicrobiota bacterium]